MGLRITTNVSSLSAQRALHSKTLAVARRSARLATGLRIATGADDPGGLGASERLRARVRSLEQARRNANDANSLVRTAEGALQEASDMVHRLFELATQAANGSTSSGDRATIASEFNEILDEIGRLSQSTRYGDVPLFTQPGQTIEVQVGAEPGATIALTLTGFDPTFTFESLTSGGSQNRHPNPQQGPANAADTQPGQPSQPGQSAQNNIITLQPIVDLRETLTKLRSGLGAAENRLGHAIELLARDTELGNMALSRIRDADLARETAAQTRDRILADASTSALAQANAQPWIALELLR